MLKRVQHLVKRKRRIPARDPNPERRQTGQNEKDRGQKDSASSHGWPNAKIVRIILRIAQFMFPHPCKIHQSRCLQSRVGDQIPKPSRIMPDRLNRGASKGQRIKKCDQRRGFVAATFWWEKVNELAPETADGMRTLRAQTLVRFQVMQPVCQTLRKMFRRSKPLEKRGFYVSLQISIASEAGRESRIEMPVTVSRQLQRIR